MHSERGHRDESARAGLQLQSSLRRSKIETSTKAPPFHMADRVAEERILFLYSLNRWGSTPMPTSAGCCRSLRYRRSYADFHGSCHSDNLWLQQRAILFLMWLNILSIQQSQTGKQGPVRTTTNLRDGANNGFTLIELMVVIAIIAILALMAIPSYQAKVVRDQIVEGSALASIAKAPIAAYWLAHQTMPPDNASMGLPAADKIVSNMVRGVTVQDGAIHIIYGNRANGLLKDKTLTMRPAVVDDAPVVPVAWVCAGASAPDKMTLRGENKTTVAPAYLPANCR